MSKIPGVPKKMIYNFQWYLMKIECKKVRLWYVCMMLHWNLNLEIYVFNHLRYQVTNALSPPRWKVCYKLMNISLDFNIWKMTNKHKNVIWLYLSLDIDESEQWKIHTISALYVQLAERRGTVFLIFNNVIFLTFIYVAYTNLHLSV